MKNKRGFTLPELLVVVVIIGVIAVIAIPSVILINKNINKRLYNSKVNMIVSAAELYATDNPDIFNGTSEVKVLVSELINQNYLKIESDAASCVTKEGNQDNSALGCIIDPVNKYSMNNEYVILRKEAVGVTATYNGKELSLSDSTLVLEVCKRLNDGTFTGKYGTGDNDYCTCDDSNNIIIRGTNTPVEACLLYGRENNNWLLYGDVYWRVMGLYDIYGNDKLVAKMITNDAIDIVE